MYATHSVKEQQNAGRAIGNTGRGRALGWLPLAALMVALMVALAAPPLAVADNPALRLVGEARLKVLLWSVYDSRLYTPDGNYREGQRPLRMEIEYLLDIESAKLVERTAQEWRAMGRSHPEEDAWLERLGALWPDIDTGDVIALELDADNQATFFLNGDKLGNLEHPEFGQQFIDIWLSPDTTRPELRLALLGKD